jgi:hypothetical protein
MIHTALGLTVSVHKPKEKSYGAAARRALRVFDWMGHGRNHAKLASHFLADRLTTEKLAMRPD